MAVFICKVADNQGRITEFSRESSSEDALLRQLQSESLHPLRIAEEKTTGAEKTPAARRFKPRAVLDFTDTLGLLLSSGLSLKDALQVALSIFKKGHEHQIIGRILEQLNKGVSFFNALTGFGDNFPPLYRGLVRIGEKIGSLDLIFTRLSKYLSDQKKLKEKIIGSLIYPVIILGMIFVMAVLMTFVAFPAISNVFTQFGAQAVKDIETRLFVYNVVMVVFFSLVMTCLAVILVLGTLRRQGGETAVKIDGLALKLPVVGTLTLYRESMSFLFAMESLTGSGYSIEEALQEAGVVLKNRALKKAVAEIREKVIRGDSIASAFREQKLFPERIAQWLLVGERSGQVEKVFSQLNAYYQGEIEKWTTRFMALIDPVLTVFIGAIVLVFILLFLLPIFSISANAIKQ